MTDGHVARQSSSYRAGLVLGLTMAEIMLLIIFCLLIALAAYLRFQKTQLDAVQAAPDPQGISQADRTVLAAVKQNPGLYEKIRETAVSPNGKAVDEFWRDLVTDPSVAAEYRKLGTPEQLRQKLADANELNSKGVDAATALKEHDIVGSIQSVMPKNGSQLNKNSIKELIQKGLDAKAGHQWPPIINLSEANGHYFKTGSAELAPDFRRELMSNVPERIIQLIQQYDVDVIEVVGHTDEQPIGVRPLGVRPSNLDQGLVPVLRNGAAIGSLVPADNAGLGLARAVSVVSILRQSKLLADYKLIPLSGAQLVNTDETLELTGTPGDIRERRRIEIRLRKSSPHDDVTATIPDLPLPKPKPKPKPILVANPKPPPTPQVPLSNQPRF
jgi:flagellar motor protein MotB